MPRQVSLGQTLGPQKRRLNDTSAVMNAHRSRGGGTPVFRALQRQKREGHEFKVRLG